MWHSYPEGPAVWLENHSFFPPGCLSFWSSLNPSKPVVLKIWCLHQHHQRGFETQKYKWLGPTLTYWISTSWDQPRNSFEQVLQDAGWSLRTTGLRLVSICFRAILWPYCRLGLYEAPQQKQKRAVRTGALLHSKIWQHCIYYCSLGNSERYMIPAYLRPGGVLQNTYWDPKELAMGNMSERVGISHPKPQVHKDPHIEHVHQNEISKSPIPNSGTSRKLVSKIIFGSTPTMLHNSKGQPYGSGDPCSCAALWSGSIAKYWTKEGLKDVNVSVCQKLFRIKQFGRVQGEDF